jgi:hypothetical protein
VQPVIDDSFCNAQGRVSQSPPVVLSQVSALWRQIRMLERHPLTRSMTCWGVTLALGAMRATRSIFSDCTRGGNPSLGPSVMGSRLMPAWLNLRAGGRAPGGRQVTGD